MTDTKIKISAKDDVSPVLQKIELEMTGFSRNISSTMKSAAAGILLMVGAFKVADVGKSFTTMGVAFNSSMERSKIGIASIITSMATLEDAQGKVLNGVEKYAAAQEIAAEMMKRIQILGLQTTATTQELVEGVQSVMGPALQAGLSLKQIPDFALNAAQAMQTMGIPLQQMRTELESLLSGNISKTQDLLAPRLGINRALIDRWKAEGTYYENMMERLKAYQLAGADVAQTLTGLWSNLDEALDVVSGKATEGLTENLKQSMRKMQDLLVSTEGKLGVGKDIQNIVNMIEELQEEIGHGLLGLTQDLIEKIKELNQPENIADIKKSFNEFKDTTKEVLKALGSVAEVIGSFVSTSVEGWRSMPDIIQELGLVGAIAFGVKGRVALLGLGAAYQELKKIFDLARSGDGGADAYKAYWAMQKRLKASAAAISQGAEVEASAIPQDAKSGRKEYKLASSIGGLADSSKPASQTESAQKGIKKLREEIERLNGTSVNAVTTLDQKLREIAKTGKNAGMSAQAIRGLQNEYQNAFRADTLKNFNKELLQAQGNTAALRDIELGRTLDEWRKKLLAANLPLTEVDEKINLLQTGLTTQKNYKDLQSAASFYQDLANLSGDYTISIEKQNELIALQAEIHQMNGLPSDLVAEWELLQKINKARDPWSGMSRSVRKFYADATDYAKNFEQATSQALNGFSSQLTSTLWKGEQDFAAFFDSIGQMLMELAVKASMANILGNGDSSGGGLLGLLGKAMGGLFGGNAFASSPAFNIGSSAISQGAGAVAVLASARGNVFSGGDISAYSNSIISEPTVFSYRRHLRPFRNGGGLMGEAGLEAVMPLARTSSGDLAVRMVGGPASAAPVVNVTIINQAGAEVQTSQRRNGNGSLDLEILLTKLTQRNARDMSRRGGDNNRVLTNEFNLSKRPIGR